MAGFTRAIAIGVLGVGIGLSGAYWYDQNRDNNGVVGSMIAGFEKRNELIVLVAQVVAVVDTTDNGIIDLLDARQTAIIPADIRYTVDMKKITGTSIQWDEDLSTMTISAPYPMIQPPNLSEERARYFRSGVLIGGDSAQRMFQDSSRKAIREAMKLAKNPDLISIAQGAAESAIENNARAFLDAHGKKDAIVKVKFVSNRTLL